jgi:hypothetical protein
MSRRDDGVIDTRVRGPADAPTWPLTVRVLAVSHVLSYAVQPVALLGLTGTAALLYQSGESRRSLQSGQGTAVRVWRLSRHLARRIGGRASLSPQSGVCRVGGRRDRQLPGAHGTV